MSIANPSVEARGVPNSSWFLGARNYLSVSWKSGEGQTALLLQRVAVSREHRRRQTCPQVYTQ
ncbi:MAG: hypothetical protein OXI16_13230 [Chloroflexota bacterium]|nr:hypothetical protein [Chloroflexota bacterium]